ncbi:topoisomerase DNA-binding C4 zinc finger domain-containing protein [Nitratireductor sp.]|uniref:topoisomerase DNA-binding C4 zinc finger domain-containing protein n=1 Tax=Nitratireductor sp. TaxID=1872084 RepID=UPI00345BEA94|nr:topoisomerase DNA-binding C4 zinc finger domain-containing protein [Nitratireductor sp.]
MSDQSHRESRGEASVCPKCGVGALVQKKVRLGAMVGCHIWPRCDYVQMRSN